MSISRRFSLFFLILALAAAGFGCRFFGGDKATKDDPPKKTENKEGKGREEIGMRPFEKALPKLLAARGMDAASICDQEDKVSQRILEEYGSVFVASGSVLPPPSCVFTSEEAVSAYQEKAGYRSEEIEGSRIELQPAAMEAYLAARDEAKAQGLDILPRGGPDAARRNYAGTLKNWVSRFEPACEHWKGKGRLSGGQVERLRALPIKQQVAEVLELEKDGIFFNTFFNNSILYSVAAPGTSQHLSMLALDVKQFDDERVRKIMAKHGWFRTVQNDNPHFTYLGRNEEELPSLGLKKIEKDSGEYWIPDI